MADGISVVSVDGRRQRGERTRQAIIEAALSLQEEGVLVPTAQQISDRAGVLIRSFFRHFEDMETLFKAADDQLRDSYEALFIGGDRDGFLEERVNRAVERRSAAFEKLKNIFLGTKAQLWRYEMLRKNYARNQRGLRKDLEAWLPELTGLPEVECESIHANDVIETALIQRATVTTWKSIWFWIFAFYMGYFWAVFMIIGQWNGMDNPNAQILIYVIGGLGFGFLMSASVKGDIYVNKDHYDLTRPINKIQMMWPFILFGLAVAHLIAGLVSHGDTLFIYNLVLFSGLSPLYVRPKGKGLLLGWTKLLGFLIIIGILLVKRLSYNS